jgi:hypothetical protein
MSANRFRQIARLEKSAKPHLARKSRIKREWPLTLRGVAAHAAVLAFLVRYGNPRIEEPLSCAIERCAESAAWKECCDEFNLTSEVIRERNSFRVVTRDAVATIGDPLRHVIISSFPGPDEKQKLDRAFAAAPPWLPGSRLLIIVRNYWVSPFPISLRSLGLCDQKRCSIAGGVSREACLSASLGPMARNTSRSPARI